jgi:hypothetical protein
MKNLLNIILRFIVITLVTVIPANVTAQYPDAICKTMDAPANDPYKDLRLMFPCRKSSTNPSGGSEKSCIKCGGSETSCIKVKITPKAVMIMAKKIARIKIHIFNKDNELMKIEDLTSNGITLNTQEMGWVLLDPYSMYGPVIPEKLTDILNIQCID